MSTCEDRQAVYQPGSVLVAIGARGLVATRGDALRARSLWRALDTAQTLPDLMRALEEGTALPLPDLLAIRAARGELEIAVKGNFGLSVSDGEERRWLFAGADGSWQRSTLPAEADLLIECEDLPGEAELPIESGVIYASRVWLQPQGAAEHAECHGVEAQAPGAGTEMPAGHAVAPVDEAVVAEPMPEDTLVGGATLGPEALSALDLGIEEEPEPAFNAEFAHLFGGFALQPVVQQVSESPAPVPDPTPQPASLPQSQPAMPEPASAISVLPEPEPQPVVQPQVPTEPMVPEVPAPVSPQQPAPISAIPVMPEPEPALPDPGPVVPIMPPPAVIVAEPISAIPVIPEPDLPSQPAGEVTHPDSVSSDVGIGPQTEWRHDGATLTAAQLRALREAAAAELAAPPAPTPAPLAAPLPSPEPAASAPLQAAGVPTPTQAPVPMPTPVPAHATSAPASPVPAPDPAPGSAPDPAPDPAQEFSLGDGVLARVCPSGHASSAAATHCRVCRVPLAGEPQRVARPILAALRWDGTAIPLEHSVVIGRSPAATGTPGQPTPRLLVVPSPDKSVSKTHCRVYVEGWSVLAEDLGSVNGTYLLRPGQAARRLTSHAPEALEMGDVLSLDDNVNIALETYDA